jgi:hypothetical protein
MEQYKEQQEKDEEGFDPKRKTLKKLVQQPNPKGPRTINKFTNLATIKEQEIDNRKEEWQTQSDSNHIQIVSLDPKKLMATDSDLQ